VRAPPPAAPPPRLDRVNQIGADDHALYGDDPSQGWAFLRKLVQLPVPVPGLSQANISNFVAVATETSYGSGPSDPRERGHPVRASSHDAAPPPRAAARPAATISRPPEPRQPNVQIITWKTMEQHPKVNQMLHRRIAANPEQSIREAKRLINVWQVYERLLSRTRPLDDAAVAVERSRNLIVLAEILTRWPALHRSLSRRVGNRRGLMVLVDNVEDDEGWQESLHELRIGDIQHAEATSHLRELLREHDGRAVADLADVLF
jgi:hypothetical protein